MHRLLAQGNRLRRWHHSNVVRARREDGPSYQFEANVSCGHVKKLYSRKGSITFRTSQIDAAGCGTGTDADGKQCPFEGLTKLEDVHTYAGGFDQEDSGSSADGQQPGSSADY